MARSSITVYHLENSRCQRVPWLLEGLGGPYEIVRYARDPRTREDKGYQFPRLRTQRRDGLSP